jgi:hypothetical protein
MQTGDQHSDANQIIDKLNSLGHVAAPPVHALRVFQPILAPLGSWTALCLFNQPLWLESSVNETGGHAIATVLARLLMVK